MEYHQIFRKLTQKLSFDKTRFYNDALKFKMINTKENNKIFGRKSDEQLDECNESEKSTHKPKTDNSSSNFNKIEKKGKKRKGTPSEQLVEDIDIFSRNNVEDLQDGETRAVDSIASTTNVKKSKLIQDQDSTERKKKKRVNKESKNKEMLKIKENVARIRKANRIHIWASCDIPDPVEAFEEIPNIGERLLENIRKAEFHLPTPIQMQAIPILLKEREILACAPTGSGKTLSFLIPIFISLGSKGRVGFRCVILTHTRELGKQIYREALRFSEGTGLRIFMMNKNDILQEKFKEKRKCDILITTPNRLVHLLKTGGISLKSVQHLVIDECDYLFEGDFREQLGLVFSSCDSPNIKRYFFSATCSYEVEEFCRSHLDNHVVLSIGPRNAPVDLVEQELIFCGSESGKLVAFWDLIRKGVMLPMLIFVQSKERAEQLLDELRTREELKCDAIHSEKSQHVREKIVDNFRTGKIWILVCTQLLARGVDFSAVKLILNYDLPLTPIQYVHSVGRTGRAGRIGHAITFFTEKDKEGIRRIAQVLENSGFPVPPYMLKLKRSRRLTREEKKKIRAPKREKISRISDCDMVMEKKRKRQRIIANSKKKLMHGSSDSDKMNENDYKKKKRDTSSLDNTSKIIKKSKSDIVKKGKVITGGKKKSKDKSMHKKLKRTKAK